MSCLEDRGKVNYLSQKIQNQVIEMLGNEMEAELVDGIKRALFYSIITETTQDMSKIDHQLSQTFRYAEIIKYDNERTSEVWIMQTFLDFISVRAMEKKQNITIRDRLDNQCSINVSAVQRCWSPEHHLNIAFDDMSEYCNKFEDAVDEATRICRLWGVEAKFKKKNSRVVRKKRHFDELAEDTRLTNPYQRFRITVFNCLIDTVAT
jgi:hypothetical protein